MLKGILCTLILMSNFTYSRELKIALSSLKSKEIYLKIDNKAILTEYITPKGNIMEKKYSEGNLIKLKIEDLKYINFDGKKVKELTVKKIKKKSSFTISKDNVKFHSYRGDMQFIVEDEHILPINIVLPEKYLYSVIPSEIGNHFPKEAIKAQTLAARTYLFYNKEKRKKKKYDLTDDTRFQVYSGMEKENKKINKLIDETKGEVIYYKSRPINAVYHSTSGGYTVNNEDVWMGKAVPYLRAVALPGFEWMSPLENWEFSMSKKEFSENAGFRVDKIRVLDVKSNRAKRIELIGEKKEIITGNELRRIFGYKNIHSTQFIIENKKGSFLVKGKGFGHGVGMIQYGAYGLAKREKLIKR